MGKSSNSKRLDIAFRATALLSRELDVDVAGGAGFRVGGEPIRFCRLLFLAGVFLFYNI
jgi:hypothetical protein